MCSGSAATCYPVLPFHQHLCPTGMCALSPFIFSTDQQLHFQWYLSIWSNLQMTQQWEPSSRAMTQQPADEVSWPTRKLWCTVTSLDSTGLNSHPHLINNYMVQFSYCQWQEQEPTDYLCGEQVNRAAAAAALYQEASQQQANRQVEKITNDPTHPDNNLFQKVPSGKHFCPVTTHTICCLDSFFPKAVALLKKSLRWCGQWTITH